MHRIISQAAFYYITYVPGKQMYSALLALTWPFEFDKIYAVIPEECM